MISKKVILGVFILPKRQTNKMVGRGYNLEQTRMREDLRRANSRLKSLYNKFGFDYGYIDEIDKLAGYEEFDKYFDFSKKYIQIKPPTDDNGRVDYKQADEIFKHLINIARKIKSPREWLSYLSKQMDIKFEELKDEEKLKEVYANYETIKNDIAPRKNMVYSLLTPNEFNQRFGHLGNEKGRPRKTYAELQPFFDAINGFIEKVNSTGEIPPI